MPVYKPFNVQKWFSLLHAIFNDKKITSRYVYVVEKLPLDVVTEVVDLLEEMPEETPYDILKNTIIRRARKKKRKLIDFF